MNKLFVVLVFLIISQTSQSQKLFFKSIPDSLRTNANAVIIENSTYIDIPSFDKMNIKQRKVITVYNEFGLKHIDAYEYYDQSTVIKKIEATIYNPLGVEIKKIKKKDFKDHSVSEGFNISNGRVLYLEYVPTQYPFTVVFESEITTSNTAFIPSWQPIDDFYLSILKSSIIITYNIDVKLKYKEINFDNTVEKDLLKNTIQYSIQNIKAIKQEELSPSINKFTPYVLFGIDKFNLEGVIGNAEDWNSFGKWYYENLLKNTEEIPVETIQKLNALIGNEKNNLKIAKIIYQYVQNRTRYVSIQLGIGGWKPMDAKLVDQLGYGDCKALTNYTRSLLKSFNIPSLFTIIYGDKTKRNFEEDFVSMQGNHAILGIPDSKNITWLECTSQTQPFGFQGDFTDDRKALIINADSAKIITTKAYNETTNFQKTNSTAELFSNGDLSCGATIISKGIIYNDKLGIELKSKEEQTKYYKESIHHINNKNFSKIEVSNHPDDLFMDETIEFTAKEFGKNNGGRIILPLNLINPLNYIPQKYRVRKNPFLVSRGYLLEDEITVKIPKNSWIEALPNGVEINTEFGNYSSTIINNNQNTITFKRTFLLKEGYYIADKYEDYRKFREQIAKNENLKIVLIIK